MGRPAWLRRSNFRLGIQGGLVMARIRTIKPEFPHSESIGALSREARLLFIMLWTIVDDSGRARASSRMLASLLYPYDDDATKKMDGWLSELSEGGHIRRYEVDGSKYLDIPKWLNHQKIDRPSKSRLPEYREDSSSPREPSSTDLGPRTLDLGPKEMGASRPSVEFEEFKKAYPRRGAANPWKPAKEKFYRLIRDGANPQKIISAAASYRGECEKLKIINTEKVAQAITWLNQERFNDYAPTPEDAAKAVVSDEFMRAKGFVWDGDKWAKAEAAE